MYSPHFFLDPAESAQLIPSPAHDEPGAQNKGHNDHDSKCDHVGNEAEDGENCPNIHKQKKRPDQSKVRGTPVEQPPSLTRNKHSVRNHECEWPRLATPFSTQQDMYRGPSRKVSVLFRDYRFCNQHLDR